MEAEFEQKGNKMGKGFLIAVGVIVVFAVIACIWIAG
jgi:hypothetical protein